MVREIWFEKSGSRNLVREKWLTRKKVILYHKSTFFQVGEKWLTRKKSEFAEPLFYTFLEKWLQIKCSREKNGIGTNNFIIYVVLVMKWIHIKNSLWLTSTSVHVGLRVSRIPQCMWEWGWKLLLYNLYISLFSSLWNSCP